MIIYSHDHGLEYISLDFSQEWPLMTGRNKHIEDWKTIDLDINIHQFKIEIYFILITLCINAKYS